MNKQQLKKLSKLLYKELKKNKQSSSSSSSSSSPSSSSDERKRKHKYRSPPKKKFKTPETIPSSSNSSQSSDAEQEKKDSKSPSPPPPPPGNIVLKSPSPDGIILGTSPGLGFPASPSPPPTNRNNNNEDNSPSKEYLTRFILTIKKQCEDSHTRNANKTLCRFYNTRTGCSSKIQTDGFGAKCTNQRRGTAYYHACELCFGIFKAMYYHKVENCKLQAIMNEHSITIE